MTAREFRMDPVSIAVVALSFIYLVACSSSGAPMDGPIFVAGMSIFTWLTTFVFDRGRA